MIKIEAMQLRRLTAATLQQLNVSDTVQVLEIRELTDGTWLVAFGDQLPTTRFPGFEIYVEADWSIEDAGRELRQELRRRLWICPLCQERGEIRRMVDREEFRVECGRCGRFEIEAGLLDHLRSAVEAGDASIIAKLPRLSARIGAAGRVPTLTMANWTSLADADGPEGRTGRE